MKITKLAMTMTCAMALAVWASPVLLAQQTVPTNQGPGQQGEFNGDHQDTGAAAIDSSEAPEQTMPTSQNPGQQGEFNGDHQDTGAAAIDSKEAPELEPTSATEPLNSSPDTDRVQDSQTDSIPD